MSNAHTVEQGECLDSIAAYYGTNVKRVWEDPSNKRLRELRKDPNVLYPGDVVNIPANEPKWVSIPTGQKHVFRIGGGQVPLKVRLLDILGRPIGDQPYRLVLDDAELVGRTTAEGLIDETIRADLKRAQLLVGDDEVEYELQVGELDPIAEVSGVQGRLINLGFECGAVDGILGPLTRDGLLAFQRAHSLDESGEPDETTRTKLVEVHEGQ